MLDIVDFDHGQVKQTSRGLISLVMARTSPGLVACLFYSVQALKLVESSSCNNVANEHFVVLNLSLSLWFSCFIFQFSA